MNIKNLLALTFLSVFVSVGTSLYGQILNPELKAELDSIMILDQGTRQLLDQNISKEKKQELLEKTGYTQDEFDANPWGIIHKHDVANQKRMYEILDQYGYPGKSMVGSPTNLSAWLVIQHSEAIEKYLPMIREAGKQGELPLTYVALMEDRFLMNQGKEQLYGSQAWGSPLKNSDDQDEQIYIIWPVKDPDHVNERRKKLGFSTTVEEYAKQMAIEYKVYTLEEAKSMFKRIPGDL